MCHVIPRSSHDTLDEAAWPLEAPWLENLSTNLQMHHLPLVSLGSGRTSLADKFRCILFSIVLESGGSAAAVQRWCSSIVTATSDMGVEVALSSVLACPLRRLFPWLQFKSDDDNVQKQGHVIGTWRRIMMTLTALQLTSVRPWLCRACCSILHNATADLLAASPRLDSLC